MPSLLFVCVENSCRSQMAEGYARRLAGPGWTIASAGSHPTGRLDARVVSLMREEAIDLGDRRSKGLEDLPPRTWDVVVTMGCGDACPRLPARRRIEWDLPDPKNLPPDQLRLLRDEIGRRVADLIGELSAATPGSNAPDPMRS